MHLRHLLKADRFLIRTSFTTHSARLQVHLGYYYYFLLTRYQKSLLSKSILHHFHYYKLCMNQKGKEAGGN